MVSFVDLDIDLIYEDKGNWQVVDEDEFLEHQRLLKYSQFICSQVPRKLQELQQRIALGKYPFDGTLNRYLEQAYEIARGRDG